MIAAILRRSSPRAWPKLAEETGFNRATLYAALKEGGNPTLDTVMKVAAAVGVQLGAKQLAQA